jgi:peptide-methionine (R)-S-oxide reductase
MTDPAPPRPAVTRRQVLLGGSLLSVGLLAWGSSLDSPLAHSSPDTPNGTFGVTHTDAEWRQLLSPQQYQVLRNADTEQP